jgi:hypothetical protein
LEEDKVLVVARLAVVTKERSLVPVIPKSLDLKVDRCPFKDAFQSLVLRTIIKYTSRQLILDALEELAQKTKASALTVQLMIDNGIVGKKDSVKILGSGELKSKVSVEAHAFSDNGNESN